MSVRLNVCAASRGVPLLSHRHFGSVPGGNGHGRSSREGKSSPRDRIENDTDTATEIACGIDNRLECIYTPVTGTDVGLLNALPLALALALALVHLLAGRLRSLTVVPRSRWLSMAGGASVAYVFVHLLPEVQEASETVDARGVFPAMLDTHVYILSLIGFATFYGLEQFVRRSRARDRRLAETDVSVFWIHCGSFAVYNALIGYLLVHREVPGVTNLLTYTVAMGLHFLVNDVGLREHHGDAYHRRGRWLLAGAIVAGCGLGYAVAVDELVLALLVAFLAGGIILNVIKEELPADRESRFWAFAAGATGYTLVLLAV